MNSYFSWVGGLGWVGEIETKAKAAVIWFPDPRHPPPPIPRKMNKNKNGLKIKICLKMLVTYFKIIIDKTSK